MRAFVLSLALVLLVPLHASSQAYPAKPIKLYVGFAPGGGTDITARIMAPKLGEILGQTVVVENRAGAGGNIATDTLAKSPPDGYTIMLTSVGPLTVSPHMGRLPYDPFKTLNDPGVYEKLREQGMEAQPSTPEEMAAFMKKEYETWGAVVRQADIKAE